MNRVKENEVNREIIVVTANNTTNAADFGGTPHSLIRGLRAVGEPARGIDVRPESPLGSVKASWALRTACRNLTIPRGWQFTREAQQLRRIQWAKSASPGARVVTLFQLPTADPISTQTIFFIDSTLRQLFRDYPEVAGISSELRVDTIERETQGYEAASHIFVRTRLAQASLTQEYGIPSEKVSFLLPGPNFDTKAIEPDPLREGLGQHPQNPLRMISIAKDFERKGIDLFAELVRLLRRSGIFVDAHVVGLAESSIPVKFREQIVFHGPSNMNDPYLRKIIEASHMGILLSRKEMAGIALLEYQACGLLPVISGVGGMLDFFVTRNGLVADPSPSGVARVACEITRLICDGKLLDLIFESRQKRATVPTWESSARKISMALSGV